MLCTLVLYNGVQCKYDLALFTDNKLFEFSETYRTKNVSLTVEVERLKRENLELQVKVDSGYVTTLQ